MRVLVTFAGGTGPFLPTQPYARQLRARGHQVRYACQPAMVALVEAAGVPCRGHGWRDLAATR
jgi:UDP:flavonoid glycosyltransferase YjiC (YdhE family)